MEIISVHEDKRKKMKLKEKLFKLLQEKSYWITSSRVWYDKWYKVYRPYRSCAKCQNQSRFATPFCPYCGSKMTHETKPVPSIPERHIITDKYGTKRWDDLFKEEQEWEARLLKGVPVEEYRAWKKKQETP